MLKKQGIGVSPGFVTGKAFVLDSEEYRIPRRTITQSQVSQEKEKAEKAFIKAAEEIVGLQNNVNSFAREEIKDLFAVHQRYLADEKLRNQVYHVIESQKVTAEYAVSLTMREIAEHFKKCQDRYISERSTDIDDIEKRLLGILLGSKREDILNLTQAVVLIARDLTPSQTVLLNKELIKGIAIDGGGATSHSAIIARALGIPAVVALEDLTCAFGKRV